MLLRANGYTAAKLHIFLSFAICCLQLMSPVSISAQQPYFSADPIWYSGSANNTRGMALGDVDGDGDLDLVFGNGEYKYGESNILYVNENGIYSVQQVWSSEDGQATSSVALGDVDGDGDLDLVFGNEGYFNKLYLNEHGTFSDLPAWSSDLANNTSSVVLGDVDGDGDLDLLCGNNGQSNVYMNHGGIFSGSPDWTWGSFLDIASDIALGDVDGDGDLDLVCGNGGYAIGQRNTLYLNEDSTFSTQPVWLSDSAFVSHSVALGDVDGDGDLDLVCGNQGQQNSLFFNYGGTFLGSPDWTSGLSNNTESIALGDVDGDGDLDLVCGNSNQANTLYLNENGIFSVQPVWIAETSYLTTNIALADIDGDGDLDLICGNSPQSNIIYLNEGQFFSTSPDWNGALDDVTRCVVLGDVDGDDDLDLVCGNLNQSNTLYLNENGIFSQTPVWSSEQANSTCSITLGDVDNDGDFDLVCGNWSQDNTLYLNEGGTFSLNPVWLSETDDQTIDVALGDIDKDGDLDLVCGNDAEPTSLYLNEMGIFSIQPVWSAGFAQETSSIALGDIDGGGDLDVVCGGFGLRGSKNQLYLNEGNIFSSMPAWLSGPANETFDIALGDIDGDGAIDLVSGNRTQASTLFSNQAGVFSSDPVWSSSQINTTSSIALGDVDGDGDLDLVCGNYSENNTLYINNKGILSAQPEWSSGVTSNTSSVAFGDVDDDGDLDLVFGNGWFSDGGKNTLYKALRNPVFKGNTQIPANHQANNSAFLFGVRIKKTAQNDYRLLFTAIDVEADPTWVLAEYQYEGAPTWYPAEVNGSSGMKGLFSTSPAGVKDSLEWDVSRLPFDGRDVVLRLRTIEVPRRVSIIRHIASYLKEIGPITPIRPEIALSTGNLSFSTITVGDTTSLDLTISNSGNVVLSVDSIALPSTEMRLDRAVPFELPPGEIDTLKLVLEPRYELGVSGELLIYSNDPITPSKSIGITTDIRALDYQTRLLNPLNEVPLGDAITVNIIPDQQVNIERAFIYYSASSVGIAFNDSLRFSELREGDFVAVIPGEAVTEAGIDYYIRVENSGVFATDPPGAPAVYFTQAVESPTLITSEPIPTSGQDYLANREIRVQVILPTGASFMDGALHYRKSGTADYMIDSLVTAEAFPKAAIPDSMVTARGIEYWVDVNTLTSHLSDPPIDPSLHPRTLPITVQNLIEPHVHKGGVKADSYRIMSIPLEFKEDFTGTIEALLSDQAAFGPYDPLKWRSWAYLPESGTYGELSDQSLAAKFRPEPERAFWLISRANHQIATAPVSGLSTPTDGTFALELASGWNMVGCPFAFPVSWDSVRVDTLSMSEAQGVSVDPPIGWSSGYIADVPTMEPFEGYWIYNRTDDPITLHIPPKEAVPEEAPATPLAARAQGSGFRLLLRVASGDQQDSFAFIGIVPQATRTLDRFDRMKPPSAPEQGVCLYFITQGEREREYRLSADMRPEPEGSGNGGEVWAFDVEKSFSKELAGDAVTVVIDSIASMPTDAKVVLVDRSLDRKVTLGERGEYTFYLGMRDYVASEEEARFRLIVGSESFIEEEASKLLDLPTQAALYQNYPNPFNPSTIIRYDVAEPGQVNLRIYSVTGALVKVLETRHQDRGRYETGWNGENKRGEQVASGIYFYRLTAPGYSQVRKMVLVR